MVGNGKTVEEDLRMSIREKEEGAMKVEAAGWALFSHPHDEHAPVQLKLELLVDGSRYQ